MNTEEQKDIKIKNKLKFNRILEGKIYPLIFLSIIVLISVILLMLVNNVTKEKIAAEREAQIVEQLSVLFPEMDDYNFNDNKDYYEILSSGDIKGYAFTTIGKGYGGDISIIVGVDLDYSIKAINVISNSETPGLGTRVAESFFTDQFKGLKVSDVNLNKDGGKIDAITGATISSKAVVNAVRDELQAKIEIIKKDND